MPIDILHYLVPRNYVLIDGLQRCREHDLPATSPTWGLILCEDARGYHWTLATSDTGVFLNFKDAPRRLQPYLRLTTENFELHRLGWPGDPAFIAGETWRRSPLAESPDESQWRAS